MEPFSYWLIGGSASDPTTRNVGWGIKQNGWTGFVGGQVATYVTGAGYKRVWLHNPFGVGKDGMSLFQAFHAAVEAPFLLEDFVEAWSPVTESGVEVVAYVGTILAVTQRSQGALQEIIHEALGPIIAAGCSLGFDYSGMVLADSPGFSALQYLRSQGIRCYLEPGVAATAPHLWGFDTVIARDWYEHCKATPADAAWFAPPGPSLTGEKVMLLQQAGDAPTALAQAKEAIAAGYTPAIPGAVIKRTDLPA